MNSKYLRKENEEDLDYAMRLIDIKKEERPDDLDWGDIVELLGLDLNKDSLRKILSTCLDIEERSKSGRIDPQIGVELLIVSLNNVVN